MTSRLITALSTVVAIVAVCIYSGTPVSGQARATPPPLVITAFGGKAVDYKAPRTPWGDPDLQGVWSSDDMENVGMAAGGGRGGFGRGGAPQAAAPAGPPPLYLDDAALAARKTQIDNAAKQRDTNADSSFRFDYARRVFPQTRLIVDPPDGRLPAIKVNQQERQMPRGTYGPGPLNSWEDFSLYERCITRGIAGSILRVIYGNGNRIVQAPGLVAFSTEMLPDTRIFYTDGRKHIGSSIHQYLGDSRAHWEGEELVVETTNLTDKTAIGVNGNGVRHSDQMVITERFRRVADNIIQYQATYDDPVTYEKPFTVSFPLTPLDGGVLLPYDCHPGNTAISMSLSAERAEDRAVAADAAKGINRPRRTVQDDGAGVGAAPPGGGRGGGRGRGAGPGQPPAGTATGERDVER
ncbi:MAG TPA: hypothetical protein VKB50_05855 [Vicinamibacterales bacterium]|nr:hypothetical protein [Vicinamibacterales bacterium]